MNKNNKKNNHNPLITVLSCTFALAAYLIADSVIAGEMSNEISKQELTKVINIELLVSTDKKALLK